LLAGVLSLSWRLSPETGPPPATPLAPNPFATAPAYELFSDEYHDDVEPTSPLPATPSKRRSSRALSVVEVEGLKDLLDDDDTSTIEEVEEEDNTLNQEHETV